MPPELVIFDCDGVPVDSEPIVARVFVEMLAEQGFELDFEGTLREFAGASMADRMETVARRLGWSRPEGFVADFDARMARVLPLELRPVAGVPEVLERIAGRRCVASNGEPAHMRARLGLTGLLQHFEPHLFSASEVRRAKPSPDLFLHAAERMGARAAGCAVVEDSVVGVRAGIAAGMRVYGHAPRGDGQLLREAGARVFARMTELPDLLAAWSPLGRGA